MDHTPAPSRRNPFRCALAVYALLIREGRVLLLRRAGSGYWDGWLGLPSGHVDGGEDAVAALLREVREETGIELDRSVCHLVLTGHSGAEEPGEDEYVDLYFAIHDRTDHWTGEPRIGEPDKATELVWADPDDLPSDTVPYVAAAIGQALDNDADRLMLRNWRI